MSHPERIIPDETEPGIVALHLKRYAFAERWCRGRTVLDAACGAGYGTAHLGGVAAHVTGVDVDGETIAYARHRYGGENVEFVPMDVAALRFEPGSFDVVCSFETVEHVPNREAFLREVVRVLRPDGTFLVSTPRAEETTQLPENPFHFVEYDLDDFRGLLERYFGAVELYGQRRLQTRRHRLLQRVDVLGLRRRIAPPRAAAALVGTRPTAHAKLDDVVIERDGIEHATELVAVCSQPRP